MENTDKIRKRDDKLLKKEKSWRRARIGAGFFAVLCFLILCMIFDEIQGYEGKVSLLGWFLFWVVVLEWGQIKVSETFLISELWGVLYAVYEK